MRVHVVTAIPHDTEVLPYVVGVFTSPEVAEEAQRIEQCITKDTCLIDIEEMQVNKIPASKYDMYELIIKEQDVLHNANV